MAPSRIVVVGAGMAGLTAARALALDHEVVVLDKGRGVGGRMATRRLGEVSVDHGAQFLTTHSETFAATVAGWEAAGVVAPWFRGQVGPDGPPGTGHVRYRGVPAMTGIPHLMATGLDVRTGVAVTSLSGDGGRWRLVCGDGTNESADAVVVTAPVPQGLALCAAGGVTLPPEAADALAAIGYEPCLAVLARLAGPSGLPAPGVVAPADGPLAWVADAALKGTSDEWAVTLHASPEVSRDRWDDDLTAVGIDLVAAADLASAPAGPVQVHRWRYSRPVATHDERCVVVDGPVPLVWAGDAFGGPNVEGAHLSGLAAAEALGARLP